MKVFQIEIGLQVLDLLIATFMEAIHSLLKT